MFPPQQKQRRVPPFIFQTDISDAGMQIQGPLGTEVTYPSPVSVELTGLTFTADTTSQSDSDPGNGKFRWNNATQSSATKLYFDNLTADGVDVSTFWADLGPTGKGFLYLQQADDSSRWQQWIWSAVTDGTGYRKLDVTLEAISTNPIQDGKIVYTMFTGMPDASDTMSGIVNITTQKFKGNKTFVDTTQFGDTAVYTQIDSFGNITTAGANISVNNSGDTQIQISSNLAGGSNPTLVLTNGISGGVYNGRVTLVGSAGVGSNIETGTLYVYTPSYLSTGDVATAQLALNDDPGILTTVFDITGPTNSNPNPYDGISYSCAGVKGLWATVAGLTFSGGLYTAGSFSGVTTSSSMTTHGVVIASGASTITSTAAMTTNQVLVGSTGADPVPTDALDLLVAVGGAAAAGSAGG